MGDTRAGEKGDDGESGSLSAPGSGGGGAGASARSRLQSVKARMAATSPT
jgi:hypothetical protein